MNWREGARRTALLLSAIYLVLAATAIVGTGISSYRAEREALHTYEVELDESRARFKVVAREEDLERVVDQSVERICGPQPPSKLEDARGQYPEYDDLSDAEFADEMYRRFYSDMKREEFDAKIATSSVKCPKPDLDRLPKGPSEQSRALKVAFAEAGTVAGFSLGAFAVLAALAFGVRWTAQGFAKGP